ncbi:trypsin-like peptidase domain-containing protein [Hyphobacterium sp. CCMP332]|nr:trypsin-like peptidase domain-containing protein [Hyphobacterium sp. CCMP332]
MNFSRFLLIFLAFLSSSVIGGWIAYELLRQDLPGQSSVQIIRENSAPTYNYDTVAPKSINIPEGLDFIFAAERVTPTVVHIRTYQEDLYRRNNRLGNLFDRWMGREGEEGYRPPTGSGSGVIISSDGFIVTNYHVVESSDEIEVILDDKREFPGKIIGTDPTTDLALIKIQSENLPFVEYGNSDNVRIGEWVLAVGNPFDLTSTVTAGIVSAKGRNINILRNNLAIESFIQTDAAVNPGNSGGALVNLKGELIGVNTAIATRTGSFAGYSFAVPVSLVQKVTEDLLEYGEVQRALLGVIIRDVDAGLAETKGIDKIKGVYIEEVSANSAALDAGLQKGDIIIAIEGAAVNSPAELQEQVAKFRPGDEIAVDYSRNNTNFSVAVKLKNTAGNTALVRRENNEIINIDDLGISIQKLDAGERLAYNLDYGVKVLRLFEGLILDQTNMEESFIITEINGEEISTPEDLNSVLESSTSRLIIEGQYPSGRQKRFQVRR